MRGGSRYSTAPPTKRGVDMSYPKAGLWSQLEPEKRPERFSAVTLPPARQAGRGV